MGYLVFNLCLSSLVLPLDTTEKSSAFLILPLIGVYKHRTDPIEPSLLKAPTSHSLSSYKKCSNPLLTSINFSWPCCSNSLSLLGPVLGSPLQHSGWLSSTEQREGMFSLSVLVMLFLVQRGLLWSFFAARPHCWLTASLLSLGSFSASIHGIIPAKCSISPFPCIELHEVTVGPFLSLSRFF